MNKYLSSNTRIICRRADPLFCNGIHLREIYIDPIFQWQHGHRCVSYLNIPRYQAAAVNEVCIAERFQRYKNWKDDCISSIQAESKETKHYNIEDCCCDRSDDGLTDIQLLSGAEEASLTYQKRTEENKESNDEKTPSSAHVEQHEKNKDEDLVDKQDKTQQEKDAASVDDANTNLVHSSSGFEATILNSRLRRRLDYTPTADTAPRGNVSPSSLLLAIYRRQLKYQRNQIHELQQQVMDLRSENFEQRYLINLHGIGR